MAVADFFVKKEYISHYVRYSPIIIRLQICRDIFFSYVRYHSEAGQTGTQVWGWRGIVGDVR